MSDTRNKFDGLVYTPKTEWLITENSDGEQRDKLIDLVADLVRGTLTVNGKKFADFLNDQRDLSKTDKTLFLNCAELNEVLAKELVEKFFQSQGIPLEQLPEIIKHWNQNVAGGFVYEPMRANAEQLNAFLNKDIQANLYIEHNQIKVESTLNNFKLEDQAGKSEPQSVIVDDNISEVSATLLLTEKGFKVANIIFSDHAIKSLYSDFLLELKKAEKDWLQQFTEEFSTKLKDKNFIYFAIKDTLGLGNTTPDDDIKALLNHPKPLEELAKWNDVAAERVARWKKEYIKSYPSSNMGDEQAIIYFSLCFQLNANLRIQQNIFYQKHELEEFYLNKSDKNNYWHRNATNFTNIISSSFNGIIALNEAREAREAREAYDEARKKLYDTTEDKSLLQPLRSAGKEVLNAVSKFTEKEGNAIKVSDRKKLTEFMNMTKDLIHNPSDNEKRSNYQKSIVEVLAMDKNKWEVVGKAMICVAGALLVAAAITALIVFSSGAALPAIIAASIAVGIKTGAIAGAATVGSVAMFGGAFFAEKAYQDRMQNCATKVLHAAENQTRTCKSHTFKLMST